MDTAAARILRVDHAGETGAIRIYTAQHVIATYFYPDICPQLEEMLAHEQVHFQTFDSLLKRRGIRVCYGLPLWKLGGLLLGTITALLGRNAIWVCTEAVETTVLNHLHDQLEYLSKVDPEVHDAVLSIKADEEAHQEYGIEQRQKSWLYRPIFFVVSGATEVAIWLSGKL